MDPPYAIDMSPSEPLYRRHRNAVLKAKTVGKAAQTTPVKTNVARRISGALTGEIKRGSDENALF